MQINSIGSSSSGNSYLIKAGGVNLLLDLGLSCSKILNAASELGIDAEDIDGVLITHEHIDHVRSVRAISKKCENAKIYASSGTIGNCSSFSDVDPDRVCCVKAGDEIDFGDVHVRCFSLSHDATEPIGYSFDDGESMLCVVTDTGIITDEIFDEIIKADILVFEANHEENLLMMGEYPYYVKMRIKSDLGHLSNVTAGEVLARVLAERESYSKLEIMLAHLSEKNNTPEQARLTIEDILRENGFENDRDYKIQIALKEGITTL